MSHRLRGRHVPAIVIGLTVVLVLAGCGLFGAGRDAEENFGTEAEVALAEAVADGDADEIRRLVQAGTSVDTQGKDGVTMLQWAIFNNNYDGFAALLDLDPDLDLHGIGGSTVVHSAAIADHVGYLAAVLERGADPDSRHGRTQETPLSQAVGPRTHDQFMMLIHVGADVNAADRTGNTPLHKAAMINAGEHVLVLLDQGADPRATNAQDATFQQYFWNTDADVMTEDALESRREVAEWLDEHDIPVDPEARWTKSA